MTEKKAPQNDEAHTPAAPGAKDSQKTQADNVNTETPKIEGSHTQETIDPAERLPDDPDEQNDLA